MSNKKVWVTWKDSATYKTLNDKVINLDDDADISDLRRAFVKARGWGTDPATLSVSEKEGDEELLELEEDKSLTGYFVSTKGGDKAGPGQSKATALVVTIPPQQPNGKLSCVICCFCVLVLKCSGLRIGKGRYETSQVTGSSNTRLPGSKRAYKLIISSLLQTNSSSAGTRYQGRYLDQPATRAPVTSYLNWLLLVGCNHQG